MSSRQNVAPNDLSAFWMPFTANRAFKKKPRLVSRAKARVDKHGRLLRLVGVEFDVDISRFGQLDRPDCQLVQIGHPEILR